MSSNCKYYEGLIGQLLDGDLLPTEEEALRLHLGNCRDCRALCRELSAVTLLVRSGQAKAPETLLPGLMERIRADTEPAQPEEEPAAAATETETAETQAADSPAAAPEETLEPLATEPSEQPPAEAPAAKKAEPEAKPARTDIDYSLPSLELDMPTPAKREQPAATPAEPAPVKIENIAVSDEPTIKVDDFRSRTDRGSKKNVKKAAKEQEKSEPAPVSRTEKREAAPEPRHTRAKDTNADAESRPAAEDKKSRPARKPVRVWPRILIAACAVLIIGGVAYGAIRIVNGESVEQIAASIPFAEELGIAKTESAEAPAAEAPDAGAGIYEFSFAEDTDKAPAEAAEAERETTAALDAGAASVPSGREADFEALLQDAKWGEEGEPALEWTVIANVEYHGVIYEFSTDSAEQYLRWRDAAEGLPVHSPGTVAELLDIIG